ncbi:histidine phosphatase family protein [Microbacterium sp. Marseille-Q6965]|uniref:histidine phosphatase family protein n=1 Tax=Microbacterium sp. Marseille-Q6965 TaxID=2965072 RepID=UPI0021B73895|nr:histidine phosphatase family protein [Microbacterium sp. Marseille-Q6965]
MTLIALVRHGQTDWNLEGRLQGSSDIPLNDTGRAQARAAAERLRGGGYAAIVASPLSRAAETARIIATELGLPAPESVAALAERGYGVAEGLDVLAARERYGDAVPGAETRPVVAERAATALQELASRHGEARVIAVSHGGVIGTLLRLATDGALPNAQSRVTNASIWVFDVTPEAVTLAAADAVV